MQSRTNLLFSKTIDPPPPFPRRPLPFLSLLTTNRCLLLPKRGRVQAKASSIAHQTVTSLVLSQCVPVPLCSSPVVSHFHEAGTHQDWDTEGRPPSLCVPVCPIVSQSHTSGTGALWDRDTAGLGHNGMGALWDRDTVGRRQNGTGAKKDRDTAGLGHNGTSAL